MPTTALSTDRPVNAQPFHAALESLLLSTSPEAKIRAFHTFYARYQQQHYFREPNFTPRDFTTPSYADFCTVVAPRNVPRRKNPATREGQITLLHAIVHIEYSAIDLALDHAYRFTGLPDLFYDDWLAVAADEVRHFEMLHALLERLGSHYGALAVHDGLFDAARKTPTLLERMAIIPRFFEAAGLDATPQILSRLQMIRGDAMIDAVVAALQVILDEEVDHVCKGDVWFDYACERAGVDKSVYFTIVERFYPGSFPAHKAVNLDARRRAGFSCDELETVAGRPVCGEEA